MHATTILAPAEIDNQGLACTAAFVEDPAANAISPDPAAREASLERLRWGIEMAHILGASVLNGEFHTPPSPARAPTADDRKRAAEVYRRAAEFAHTAGLHLAIEGLNRFESPFLSTVADTRALVKQVDHTNFRMMYDTFHAHIEEKAPGQSLREAADSIIHIHISENDRGTPGSGQVRWTETFQALKAIGYDDWLVIEAFKSKRHGDGYGHAALARPGRQCRRTVRAGIAFHERAVGGRRQLV